MILQTMLLPLIFGLIISLAITYITINLYRGLGIVDKSTAKDHPKNIHLRPVPRGGGIPIFISIFLVASMFMPMDGTLILIILGAFVLMILGVMDDIFNLSPYIRLIIGLIVSAIVVYGGVKINFISNPFGGAPISFENVAWLSTLISILWITWSMNFVNMGAKGLDGQLPGVVVIAAIVMGLVSNRFIPDQMAIKATFLAFLVAGSYLGLLFFNAYPQKIMPGWGAGSQAGYLLAVISMLSGAKLATALIVLGIPLMDVIYAIIRRVKKGQSPVWGDAEHLHHKLLAVGYTKKQVAAIYWVFSGILGLLALGLNSRMKIYTIFLIAIVVGGILTWINSFLSSNRRA